MGGSRWGRFFCYCFARMNTGADSAVTESTQGGFVEPKGSALSESGDVLELIESLQAALAALVSDSVYWQFYLVTGRWMNTDEADYYDDCNPQEYCPEAARRMIAESSEGMRAIHEVFEAVLGRKCDPSRLMRYREQLASGALNFVTLRQQLEVCEAGNKLL